MKHVNLGNLEGSERRFLLLLPTSTPSTPTLSNSSHVKLVQLEDSIPEELRSVSVNLNREGYYHFHYPLSFTHLENDILREGTSVLVHLLLELFLLYLEGGKLR